MLIVGSAGRNTGKTGLACAIIRKFARTFDIIGIKVTTVSAPDGQCPRGGKGCGVCSSIEGNFSIVEEMEPTSAKDTSRLLAAGAHRVFWLRVPRDHLHEGAAALLDVMGPDSVCVCESNSLREVVVPGLFLVTAQQRTKKWKSSAHKVRDYADRIIESDGQHFDFELERLKLTNGPWTITEKATAIVLAGGSSSRMGTDKALLSMNGRTIIETICEQLGDSFEQTLISANEPEKLAFLNSPIVKDRIIGQGPLMGIASALEASANDLNFVTACDVPDIDLHFVRQMLRQAQQADIVIPTYGNGENEPLFGIYRKKVLPIINEVLSSGRRKISDIFGHCKVEFIDVQNRHIANLNTMHDFEHFREKAKNGP